MLPVDLVTLTEETHNRKLLCKQAKKQVLSSVGGRESYFKRSIVSYFWGNRS